MPSVFERPGLSATGTAGKAVLQSGTAERDTHTRHCKDQYQSIFPRIAPTSRNTHAGRHQRMIDVFAGWFSEVPRTRRVASTMPFTP